MSVQSPKMHSIRAQEGKQKISMQDKDVFFVIPTYRLRDVGETVELYDEHFWRNGHTVRMLVFDDSSRANQEKYDPLLEQTRTHNDVYYVGPGEKEQFLAYLNGRLRDTRLEPLVKDLFRPSYGGNRNYTLMYTLGGMMVSSDNDSPPPACASRTISTACGFSRMASSPPTSMRHRPIPRAITCVTRQPQRSSIRK
jgi:hypothetical protein